MARFGSRKIWQKSGGDSLSSRQYAWALGAALTWAVFLVALSARISYNWSYGLGLVLFTFIFSIIGIVIFNHSDSPVVSLIGVSILSFFMGLSIGPVLSYYQVGGVMSALVLTVFVTIGMAILGALLPDKIIRYSGVLFVGLLILLVGYLSSILLSIFGISAPFGILDWFGLIIFSLYIWYDWARAMKLPKTLNNAIDVSGALIIDIVNVFLDIIDVVARRKK
jgi:FtsH-binding integral membrane protein